MASQQLQESASCNASARQALPTCRMRLPLCSCASLQLAGGRRQPLLLARQAKRATQQHSRRLIKAQVTQSTEIPAAELNGAAMGPGLIFPRGTQGSWDEAGVGSPVVRCYLGDNEQRWYMWYSGRSDACPDLDAVSPSSGCVGVAVSSDGVRWFRSSEAVSGDFGAGRDSDVGRMLQPNGDWWAFDTCHLTVGDVQVISNGNVTSGVGVYWMFYSAGAFEPVLAPEGLPGLVPGTELEGLRTRPGLAMSQDGRNWARIEGEHHTNALLDVGEPGEWDELLIGSPQVVVAGKGDMRMYYHSYSPATERWQVGLATSPDGFKWRKAGPIFGGSGRPGAFDEHGVAFARVERDTENRQYVMFFEGVAADGARSIGVAVSKDGTKDWKQLDRPLLEASGETGAWDSGSVGAPCGVAMAGGRWRLYYTGRRSAAAGPWEGIGMALSQDGGETFEGFNVSFSRRGAAA